MVLQIALPLRWYLAPSRDHRFAWRMFSSDQLERCDYRLYDVDADGQTTPFDVKREHGRNVYTVGLLEAAHPVAVDALLRWRCETSSSPAARYEAVCTGVDGGARPPIATERPCER